MEPIPHMWEEDGMCWLPKLRRDIKVLQCNSSSVPDKQHWMKYSYVVKGTWAEANSVANALCDAPSTSTTEEEDEPLSSRRTRKVKYNDASPTEAYNLDDTGVAHTIVHQDDHAEVNSLRNFLEEKLVSLSLVMDNILRAVQNRDESAGSHDIENSVIDTQFFPISSKPAMYSFEDSLQNEEYQKKDQAFLGSMPATSLQVLCLLSEFLDILVQYSWTGVSRTEIEKDTFSKLTNILVIRFSDISFSYANREAFFKDKLLKHSYSRLHPKKKNKENVSPQVPEQLEQMSSEMVEVGLDYTADI
nr:unnamed protein product [Callosobruchus analis]